MKTNWQTKGLNFFEIYKQAHDNAVELLKESKILFDNKCYPRSYFLAYTALEEISKSQLAADVDTRYINQEEFSKYYKDHKGKLDLIEWAHDYADSYPHNMIWLGPDIEDVEKISPSEPLWEKRQNSLYVNILGKKIVIPSEEITIGDAKSIIHIVETALHKILEITEYYGNKIGTKGFMK